jgi:LDH2 family malate/lactate/ureidoglycolate dehydrogenase
MALPHDAIGVSMTNVIAAMPPTGGAEPRQNSNPYSVAIGAGSEATIVVDSATNKGTWGKVVLAIQRGEPVPGGADKDGNPTTDAPAVLDSGLLLPIAEYKGYGLAVAVDPHRDASRRRARPRGASSYGIPTSPATTPI